MIFIDDIEFADQASIILFSQVIRLSSTFCVVSSGNKRTTTPAAVAALKSSQLKAIYLKPIETVHLKSLASGFLKVDALDIDIEMIIHLKSRGNPGWMKKLLNSMLYDGHIKKVAMTAKTANALGYVFSAPLELKTHTQHKKSFINSSESRIQALEFCKNYASNHPDLHLNNKIVTVATLSPVFNFDAVQIEGVKDGNRQLSDLVSNRS